MSTKTRVVKIDEDKFIPQIWVPHFLWGGHWESLYLFYWSDSDFEINKTSDPEGALKHTQPSQEKANEVIDLLLKDVAIKEKLLK